MTWYQSVIRWNFDEETQPILTNLAQEEWTVQVIAWEPTDISSGGSRGGARGAQAPPLFLDQTEAQRAENFFFGHRPPPLSKGLDDPHPLSQGLDPALIRELKQRRRRRQRERQKCNRFRIAKQQLCTCIMLFCTFLYRHCTTTTWKCLFSRFVEDVNSRQRLSFLFLHFHTVF